MEQEKLDKLKKIKAFQILPTLQSKDIEWINWMKALDKDFDRSTSVSLFLNLWSKRGSNTANTLELRQYMKSKYNVDLSEGAIDKIVDLGGDVGDTISGIFKVGKYVTFAIGGVIILAVGGAIYSIIKNPSNIAYATPQGRALKMMK